MKSSSKLIPEPEPPQGLRKTAFFTTASLALDRGFGLLETAYPAARIATPVAKRLALPMVMKAHEKFGKLSSKDKGEKSNDKSHEIGLKRSGSFRDKFRSLIHPESDHAPESKAKQVDDSKEKSLDDENSGSGDESLDGSKHSRVRLSSPDKISGIKTKVKSRVLHRNGSSKKPSVRRSPAPVASRSKEEANSSVKKTSHKDASEEEEDEADHEESVVVPSESLTSKRDDRKSEKKSTVTDDDD